MLGFLSGMNAVLNEKNGDIIKNLNAESLFLWIENYCLKNPLEDIYHGTILLYFELMYKKRVDEVIK
jgi:hypothetical protein